MSWSVTTKGTVEEVKEAVAKTLDASAAMYAGYGTPDGDAEAQDCRDAKRMMLARIDAISLEPNAMAPKGFIVSAHGWGSRSNDGTMMFQANVAKNIVE